MDHNPRLFAQAACDPPDSHSCNAGRAGRRAASRGEPLITVPLFVTWLLQAPFFTSMWRIPPVASDIAGRVVSSCRRLVPPQAALRRRRRDRRLSVKRG